MLDPIADMLTRIRNAQMARKDAVIIPASKIKIAIAQILNRKGFIDDVKTFESKKKGMLKVKLKYTRVSNTQKSPAINVLERVSKQGKRIYLKKDQIFNIKSGLGIGIISTSKGVMTSEEAKKAGLGGEYICKVW